MVFSFYEKATTDFMIGYQFRKIATLKGAHPLAPPMDAFKEHLPKIEKFWHIQLLGEHYPGFHLELLSSHQKLNIKRAELKRWLLLFTQTLEDKLEKEDPLKSKWLQKLPQFEQMFERLF